MQSNFAIPLMRPHLPERRFIDGYLDKIDQNRWYSNFGPLVRDFEERIAAFLDIDKDMVVTVSSATSGLVNTLRVMDIPEGKYCLLPAWTFIATPASAYEVGLVPYFVDIDASNWALTPKIALSEVKRLGRDKIGAVITVAPYGSPLDCAAWDAFTKETGVPVVIDAAAAFDAVSTVSSFAPSKTPMVISMHATKSFGCGEGGLVISTDAALVRNVLEQSNFGFSGSRIVHTIGVNSKMSEYTAAVAHAALDLWPQKRELWLRLKRQYINKLKAMVQHCPMLTEEWVSSTLNVHLPEGTDAAEVISGLTSGGIESRQWWGKGCHAHPAYAKFPCGALTNTIAISRQVIALPFSIDMTEQEIQLVTQQLEKAVKL